MPICDFSFQGVLRMSYPPFWVVIWLKGQSYFWCAITFLPCIWKCHCGLYVLYFYTSTEVRRHYGEIILPFQVQYLPFGFILNRWLAATVFPACPETINPRCFSFFLCVINSYSKIFESFLLLLFAGFPIQISGLVYCLRLLYFKFSTCNMIVHCLPLMYLFVHHCSYRISS